MKKTSTKWSTLHWCRKHQKFIKGHHLDECDLLTQAEFLDYKPTHYNTAWSKETHLSFSLDQLARTNNFYQGLKTRLQ